MQPKFFVDRNLGTRILPGLLRENGWDITTLSEVFGERPGQATKDEDWLEFAGSNGFAVLMKDKRIRYRAAETDALLSHGVTAFCLSKAGLDGPTQAHMFLKNEARIMSLASQAGPAIYMVSSSGVKRATLQ